MRTEVIGVPAGGSTSHPSGVTGSPRLRDRDAVVDNSMNYRPELRVTTDPQAAVRERRGMGRAKPRVAPDAERPPQLRVTMSRADRPCGHLSDNELMESVVRGDVEAFEQIVHRYWAGTLVYVRHITNDPDAALDVTQEVFSRLWTRREGWSGSGSVRVWLLRTARNLVVSARRHWKVRARGALELAKEYRPARTPLQHVEATELREAIDRAIRELPPRRREVFSLVHLQGLSYREVSEIMGIRPQTVANYLQLAVRDLRVMLAPRFAADGDPDAGSDAAGP